MRLVFVLLALLLAGPAAAHVAQTKVWIASEQPLKIRGSGFAAADRVTVTVHRGQSVFRKTVTATSTGAFRAVWVRGLPTVCASTKVLAVGKSGRRATYVIVVNDCPNPPPQS